MPLTLDISIFAMPRLTTKQSQNSSLNAGIEIGRFLKNSNSRKLVLKPTIFKTSRTNTQAKNIKNWNTKAQLCAISLKLEKL